MNKIIALLAGTIVTIVMCLSFSVPAQAATGLFSHAEANSVCMGVGSGCDGVDSQANVESKCNCTGDKVSTWTSGGVDYKQINYNDTYETGGVQVVYRDGGAHWRVHQMTWCDGSGCYYYFET